MSDWTCSTCGLQPCVNPSFCKLCRTIDQRLARDREMVRTHMPSPVAQSTLDAAIVRRQQEQG